MDNDKLNTMFAEFLLLYKVVNRRTIVTCISSELKNPLEIKIYQLTDGTNSTRDIAKSLGEGKCSHGKVASLWKRWALAGIVLPAERVGRFKAAFNLTEYGIVGTGEEED